MEDVIITPKRGCLVVGHCKGAPGAISEHMGSEFDHGITIINRLHGKYDSLTYDNFDKGYTNTIINDMAPRTKDYILGLELHFNAFSKESANGCEALYWHTNKKAKMIAEFFCEQLEIKFGIKNRGPKAISSASQRGYAALAYQKPTYLILEPGFGTNISDSSKLGTVSGRNLYSEVIDDTMKYGLSIL